MSIITLIILTGLLIGMFLLLRAAKRRISKARSSRRYNQLGRPRKIIDSIESYLVEKHGFTVKTLEKDDDPERKACYRDLDNNLQLFILWHPASYLSRRDLHGSSSRTVNVKSDAVSMRIALLSANGTHWQEELNWGVVKRSKWNGKPKGFYSKPLDQKINAALAFARKKK